MAGICTDLDHWPASIGGKLTPRLGGLDWPTFNIEKLSIDSDGNVRLEGGWLNLPNQYSLNFYGFQFEITKLDKLFTILPDEQAAFDKSFGKGAPYAQHADGSNRRSNRQAKNHALQK